MHWQTSSTSVSEVQITTNTYRPSSLHRVFFFCTSNERQSDFPELQKWVVGFPWNVPSVYPTQRVNPCRLTCHDAAFSPLPAPHSSSTGFRDSGREQQVIINSSPVGGFPPRRCSHGWRVCSCPVGGIDRLQIRCQQCSLRDTTQTQMHK